VKMRCLGLDLGGKRTGVAISDPEGILATPLTVLASKDEDGLIDEIFRLVDQYKAECIVVGLPRRLDGEQGGQANKAAGFADKLICAARQGNFNQLDVQLWDERLSTKAAVRLKVENGRKGNRGHFSSGRRARRQRFSAKAGIDEIAAAIILQGFLDSRRGE
jgi:putative Holliday junction resolvase